MKRIAPTAFALALVAAAVSTVLSPVVAFSSTLKSQNRILNSPAHVDTSIERTMTQLTSTKANIEDDIPLDNDFDNEHVAKAADTSISANNAQPSKSSTRILERRRKHWINRSLKYYTTVAREPKRRTLGQLPPSFPRSSPDELSRQISMAERHYFARSLIKSGKLTQAEKLYQRIIHEIETDEKGCDHARLAVSTLLLALLKQRMNDVKGTRSVFLQFFRTVVVEYPEDKECACSAKVLQAYALFEMKRGFGRKSLEIVEKAVELDEDLRPVLGWKQFREVMEVV